MAGRTTPWTTILVSIMATQASAITFLSAPGLAYAEGMGFVQFYFGLPLAMVALATIAVPIYHRLQVYTAYEYLEARFDLKTRSLATALFLASRGVSTGISIYATSIVLSVLLGWNVALTNLVIGGAVVVYTTTGGSRAVNWTQSWQFLVATGGLALAFVVIVFSLPPGVSLLDALHVAGRAGRLKAVDWTFDLSSRYNVWSGLIGGFFLALSYFGTDQSQVGRYLGGRTAGESRLGLLFNGLLKVPMQAFILLVGVMVFVFYQFSPPPLFFNPVPLEKIRSGPHAAQLSEIAARHQAAFEARREATNAFLAARAEGNAPRVEAAEGELSRSGARFAAVRTEVLALVRKDGGETNDTNYVFLAFVLRHLPAGIVGLVVAVVFSAAMSSIAAALQSLASTSVVDVYGRLVRKGRTDAHYVRVGRLATVFWGFVAIAVAMYASRLGTLIEAVNILGSLVYGTILGIFLVAFLIPSVRGTAVFVAALVSEALVLVCWQATALEYLWYNVVGCLAVVVLSLAMPRRGAPRTSPTSPSSPS